MDELGFNYRMSELQGAVGLAQLKKLDKIIRPKNHKLTKRLNRQDMKTQFCENGAIYISKHSSFQKSKCRVSGKIGLYEMTESSSLQVDSKYDLFLIEQILKTRKYHEK